MLLDTRPQPDSDDAKKGREDMAQLAEREGASPIAERLVPRLLSPDTVANRQDVVDTLSAMITQCPVEGIAGDLRGNGPPVGLLRPPAQHQTRQPC